jgi:Papain family cysteine protease
MRQAGTIVAACVVLSGVVSIAVVPPVMAKRAPKPPACPGGRFPIPGEVLVPGGLAPDAVVIDAGKISVASGCPPVEVKPKRTRTQTVLRARWAGCGTLSGRTTLNLTLDATTCESLNARFRNRKAKVDRRVSTQIEVPADATRRVRDGLPEGAVVVTPEEFDQLKQRPDFHSLGRSTTAMDEAEMAARTTADEQTVQEFLLVHPELAGQILGAIDLNAPGIVQAEAGDYDVTFTGKDGLPQTVRTHGRGFARGNVAGALRRFPTKENQLARYTDVYEGLAAIDPALVGNFPELANAATQTVEQLRALNDYFTTNYQQFVPLVPPPGGVPPPGYPATCAAEEHSGDGTDRTGARPLCTERAPLGVWENFAWPLKFLATCVKNQAARGTCWSFATAGAVELTVAKKYGRWINLSEQDLIYRYHWLWFRSLYGDGGWPGLALREGIANGYFFPWESQYDYNPSRRRSASNATRTYRNSCADYAGDEQAYCSDTAGQGQIVCINLVLFYICGVVAPDTTAHSGFQPTGYSELWDAANPTRSLAAMTLAVALFRKPVIYSFNVAPSFYPDDNGYVRYNGPHCPLTTDASGNPTCVATAGCECGIGGHAVLITGIIDNARLPPGAPLGAGGGYFIIKNSWGCGYGDAGYAYLPFDWVKAYGWSAEVLGDVN